MTECGRALESGEATRSPRLHDTPSEAPVEALREIVRHHGTPAYAYDIARIRGSEAARILEEVRAEMAAARH